MGSHALTPISTRGGFRARRWDALVLGGGVAGLVAAARIGMAGQRVLVVEEDVSAECFPGLREPFFLAGARDGGVLDACLRALTLALIERRRLVPQELAYQVAWPELRVDVGMAEHSADELAAWGLLESARARAWTRSAAESAAAEGAALLAEPRVHAGRSRARPFGRLAGDGRRQALETPDPSEDSADFGRLLDAQLRALSNLGRTEPGPEQRTRLLGNPLAGGTGFNDGPPWLVGLLRRRVESVYGELRSVSGDFRLINANGQPGIELRRSGDLWLGRILVIAAPTSGLAAVLDPTECPAFLPKRAGLRRRAYHLRLRRSVLPEGMAQRLVVVADPEQPLLGSNHLSLSTFVDREDPEWLDLVVRCVLEQDEDPAKVEGELIGRLAPLFPFAEGALVQKEVNWPRWDDDGWLEDIESGTKGSGELALRVSSRPPVYRLDRSGVAGYGLEGDLLLGWRGGDSIAAELA